MRIISRLIDEMKIMLAPALHHTNEKESQQRGTKVMTQGITERNSLTLMCPSSLPPSPPLSLLGGKNKTSDYEDVWSYTNNNSTCEQDLPFFSSPSFSSSFFTRLAFLWLAAFLRPPPCPSASSSESENSSSQAILLSWARTETHDTHC